LWLNLFIAPKLLTVNAAVLCHFSYIGDFQIWSTLIIEQQIHRNGFIFKEYTNYKNRHVTVETIKRVEQTLEISIEMIHVETLLCCLL